MGRIVTKEEIVQYNLHLLHDERIRYLYQNRLTKLIEKDHKDIRKAIRRIQEMTTD